MADALIDLIRSSPTDPAASDAQVNGFHAKLTEAICKGGKKLLPLADRAISEGVLVPQQGHALACAELLSHRVVHGGALTLEFVDLARLVFYSLSPREAQLASKAITNISRHMTKLLIPTTLHVRGIGPLKAIINTIAQLTPSVVTAIHVDLLLLTLKAHAYDLVSDLGFLSSPTAALTKLDPSRWPIETADYLQLWYYAGMYHSAWQHFEQATEAFMLCLSIPNNGAVSAVQVEAYKKLTLVSLLATGEAPVLNQRLSSQVLLRYLETLTAAYSELAKAVRKCSSSSGGGGGGGGSGGSAAGGSSAHAELNHLVESYAEIFLADKNLGLVKQIIRALSKKQITRLTQTYITCSLDDVAAHVAVAGGGANAAAPAAAAAASPVVAAERQVFDMICLGDVHARLDSSARMVRFLDGEEDEYDDSECLGRMDRKIQEITALNAALADRERELQVAPAYLLRVLRQQNSGGGGGGGAGGHNEAMEMAMAQSLSLEAMGPGGGGIGMGGGAGIGGMGGIGGGGRFASEDDDLQRAMAESLMQQ